MSFKLLDYQEKTVQFGVSNPYAIYALEMGLGKSLSSLETAIRTKSKTLIVVPPYLALNWKAEIKKFFPEKNVALLRHKKQFYRPFDDDFVIITYSFVGDAEILFEWADMVICDECQMLKDMKAKRTEAVHRLIYENSISRVLLLTGTPILNRLYELHSLLAIMNYNPRIEESAFLKRFPTYVQFANYFSILSEREIWRGNKKVKIQEWSGHRNTEELKQILAKHMIRFKSSDVLSLPPSEDINVMVDDIDQSSLLMAFEDFRSDPENNSVLPKIKAEAALQKASLTVEYVKGLLETGVQVIVYSDHVASAEKIAHFLGVSAITGETNMDWRMRYANEFQRGESQVLVATIGAFSTGINLQNAFNMVFNDINWVPGNMEQAKFRIVRVGQKNKCKFHYILGSYQDEYILNTVLDKKNTIDAVI